jgi:hypothetical protein
MSLTGTDSGDVVVVRHTEDVRSTRGEYWPINWSAIWVGVLSALAVALIVSLIGAALGAHQLGPGGKIAKWSDVGLAALVFAILGSFFAFVVGGWVAGKINGFRHAETDMLHGAIVWLLALPILVGLAAVGAGTLFGGWYAGLAGIPVWANQASVAADPNAAAAARNAALLAVTAILIGLVGSVLGGWMASGEAMSLRLRSGAARVTHEPHRSAV